MMIQLKYPETADTQKPILVKVDGQINHLTDLGNAQRLAARYKGCFFWCEASKCFLAWNGKYWQKDDSGQLMRFAKDTALSIYIEAANETDDAKRRELVNHAKRSESEPKLQAMIALVKSEVGIP